MGFQGQEEDDEIKGEGNSVNFEFRMHDPRLGRFFAVDPLSDKYPHNSPYAFSENRVIDAVELEGLEIGFVVGASGRVTKGISLSTSLDLMLYFDGVINDDPFAVKLLNIKTDGVGIGFSGLSGDFHFGVWLGNDDNIAGNSVIIGIEAQLPLKLS